MKALCVVRNIGVSSMSHADFYLSVSLLLFSFCFFFFDTATRPLRRSHFFPQFTRNVAPAKAVRMDTCMLPFFHFTSIPGTRSYVFGGPKSWHCAHRTPRSGKWLRLSRLLPPHFQCVRWSRFARWFCVSAKQVARIGGENRAIVKVMSSSIADGDTEQLPPTPTVVRKSAGKKRLTASQKLEAAAAQKLLDKKEAAAKRDPTCSLAKKKPPVRKPKLPRSVVIQPAATDATATLKALALVLRQSPALTLQIRKCRLSLSDASHVDELLTHPQRHHLRPFTGLRSVRLQCMLPMEASALVSKWTRHHCATLTVLDLSRNKFTSASLLSTAADLKLEDTSIWPNLEMVDFSYNPVSQSDTNQDDGSSVAASRTALSSSSFAVRILRWLRANDVLKCVALDHCGVTDDDVPGILEELTHRPWPRYSQRALLEFDVSARRGYAAALHVVARHMEDQPVDASLARFHLRLCENRIGSSGMRCLQLGLPTDVSVSATRQRPLRRIALATTDLTDK